MRGRMGFVCQIAYKSTHLWSEASENVDKWMLCITTLKNSIILSQTTLNYVSVIKPAILTGCPAALVFYLDLFPQLKTHTTLSNVLKMAEDAYCYEIIIYLRRTDDMLVQLWTALDGRLFTGNPYTESDR